MPPLANTTPLRAGIDWQLAPVDFIWFGKSGAEICAQLKDPKRNGTPQRRAGPCQSPSANIDGPRTMYPPIEAMPTPAAIDQSTGRRSPSVS